MTRLTVAAFLVLILALPAWAEEYPNNPDRRASIGFALGLSGGSGDVTVTDSSIPASFKQNVSGGDADLTIDTRIPVSNNWTLTGALSLMSSGFQADETFFLNGQEGTTGSFGIRLGARYYFGQ